ncbi:hypothetical protein [Streptomyces celluloflavus]|uniref:hypothetical protein n=1 Tax=Streptomyces celluloflavus TaxID=58344 RepID=UPI00346087BA|nr:hypothetical protein OG717_29710 [Streptomyces celluloflavus]
MPVLASSPAPRAPSATEISKALDVLYYVELYLREPTSVPDARAVLAQVLDEEDGVAMSLGNILRSAARLIEEHALLPWPVEIRDIIARLRATAPEVTDCHDLHWDIHRLGGLPFDSINPSGSST